MRSYLSWVTQAAKCGLLDLYKLQMRSLSLLSPFMVCKRGGKEEEVFREEAIDLEWERGRTAVWPLSKDAFRNLVRGFY